MMQSEKDKVFSEGSKFGYEIACGMAEDILVKALEVYASAHHSEATSNFAHLALAEWRRIMEMQENETPKDFGV